MKHRIVLMAKSKKGKDGYCVAGIDSDSGEWVRLNVPGYYSIPKDMFKYSDGTEPELLDLISVEITGKDNRDTWQPENHFCRLKTIEKEAACDGDVVLARLQEDSKKETILYSDKPFVETEWLNNYVGEKYSLIAIEPEKLRFVRKNEKVVTAAFKYNGVNYSGIRITDLDFLKKCENQKTNQHFYADKDYILVVSLGLPFINDYNGREENWKLIASVIDKSKITTSQQPENGTEFGASEGTENCDALYDALRIMRAELAQKEGIPAYCVFHDKTLKAIAEAMPASLDELLQIKGAGPQNVRKYGEVVLKIIEDYADSNEYGISKTPDEEEVEIEFTIEHIDEKTEPVDFNLLLKMITTVAEGVDPDTGEIIDVDSIINNKAFKAAIKTINKKYSNTTPQSKPSGKSASEIYSEYEKKFPNHVIIRKEGFFYTTRNDSAVRLHDIVGYKLNKDKSGRYITGGPNLELITGSLKEHGISYVLVVGDEIKEEYFADEFSETEPAAQPVNESRVETDIDAGKNFTQKKEEIIERSCNNCKLYRKEECAGLNGLCDDYEFAPTIPKEEVDNWPTEMGPYVTGYGRRRR